MQEHEMLRFPENRIAVLFISQQVLNRVAPEEAEISAGLLEPYIDMAAEGKVATVDNLDKEGGFGSIDLMAAVIVPVVVTVMGKLLVKLGEDLIDTVKQNKKKKKMDTKLIEINLQGTEIIVQACHPPLGKQKVRKLAEAINVALMEYLSSP